MAAGRCYRSQHQCVDGKSPAESADLQAAESRNAQVRLQAFTDS